MGKDCKTKVLFMFFSLAESMKTSHLGIKISIKEKEALDYITDKSHITKSRLLYPVIKKAIAQSLGIVLIYTIGYRKKEDYDEMKGILEKQFLTDIMNSIHHLKLPNAIDAFFDTIAKKNFWNTYRVIFNDVEFKEIKGKDDILRYIDIDLLEIAEYIGTTYMALGGTFDSINLKLAKSILFERLFWEIFYKSAKCPYNEAKRIWAMKKGDIRTMLLDIIDHYDKKFESTPVEVIEVIGPKNRKRKGVKKKQ